MSDRHHGAAIPSDFARRLFGLTVSTRRPGVYFVNDAQNTLDLLH